MNTKQTCMFEKSRGIVAKWFTADCVCVWVCVCVCERESKCKQMNPVL